MSRQTTENKPSDHQSLTLPRLTVNTYRHYSCHLNFEGIDFYDPVNTPPGLGLSSVSISFTATVDKR